jgi:hypothetical protein
VCRRLHRGKAAAQTGCCTCLAGTLPAARRAAHPSLDALKVIKAAQWHFAKEVPYARKSKK